MKNVLIIIFGLLIFSFQSLAQHPFIKEARTGQIITLIINNAEPVDSFNVYRKTGVTSVPVLLSSIAARPGIYRYAYSYVMPGGTTPQYRFWVAVKRKDTLEGESNIVRVKRIR